MVHKKVFQIEVYTQEEDFSFSDLKECLFDGVHNVGNHQIIEINDTTSQKNTQTNPYAVIRIETKPEHEENEEANDFINDFEFTNEQIKRFEEYLKYMDANGELIQSDYVGNAYFIECKNKQDLIKLYNILREDTNNQIPETTHITIEHNYYPEWADAEDEE